MYSKLAFTQKGKIFLIGGSKDQKQSDLIAQMYELVLPSRASRRKQEPDLKEKAPMSVARIAFGCAVDNYG